MSLQSLYGATIADYHLIRTPNGALRAAGQRRFEAAGLAPGNTMFEPGLIVELPG